MACIYIYTNPITNKTNRYKTLEQLINANTDILWSSFVDYMKEVNNVGNNYDFNGKASIDAFRNYVSNSFTKKESSIVDNPSEEVISTLTEEEKEQQLFKDVIVSALSDFILLGNKALIEGKDQLIKNKHILELIKHKIDELNKTLGNTQIKDLTDQDLAIIQSILNEFATEAKTYLLTDESVTEEDINEYQSFVRMFTFTGSQDIRLELSREELASIANFQDAHNQATAVSSLQYEENESNEIINKLVKASEQDGMIELDELLNPTQQSQLTALLSLNVGDEIVARIDTEHTQYEENKHNPLTVPIALYKVVNRKEVKIGYLNKVIIDNNSNKRSPHSTTTLIRGEIFAKAKNKVVKLKVDDITNTGDNVWIPRQTLGANRGVNNRLIKKVVAKFTNNSRNPKQQSHRIARVSRVNGGVTNVLYDVVTGKQVSIRSTNRTNKFYIEVPTIGNNSVWIPLHNSTIGEASDINNEFNKHLITETALRLREYIVAMRKYNSAIDENKEAAKDKMTIAYSNLNQLVALGTSKGILGDERIYLDGNTAILKSTALIGNDGNQHSMIINIGKSNTNLTIAIGSSSISITPEQLDTTEVMEIFENIASGMTRQIEITEDSRIDLTEKVEFTLRDRQGNLVHTAKFNNQLEYVEQTGALLTDIGAITKNGTPISNLNLAATALFNMKLSMKTESKTDLNYLRLKEVSPVLSAQEFFTKYITDANLLAKLEPLIAALDKAGTIITVSGATNKQLSESKTGISNPENTYLVYNNRNNTIDIVGNFLNLINSYKEAVDTNNKIAIEDKANLIQMHLVHEGLHPVLSASFSSFRGVGNKVSTIELNSLLDKLDKVIITVQDNLDKLPNDQKQLVSKWLSLVVTKLDKAHKSAKGGHYNAGLEEIFTYPFTNSVLANALNSIYYDVEGQTSKTVFQKLIDILLDILGIVVKDNTVLHQLTTIINQHFNNSDFWGFIEDNSKDTEIKITPIDNKQENITIDNKEDSENIQPSQEGKEEYTISQTQLIDFINSIKQLLSNRTSKIAANNIYNYVESFFALGNPSLVKSKLENLMSDKISDVYREILSIVLNATLNNQLIGLSELLEAAASLPKSVMLQESSFTGALINIINGIQLDDSQKNIVNDILDEIEDLLFEYESSTDLTESLDIQPTPLGYDIIKTTYNLLSSFGEGVNNTITTSAGRQAIELYNSELNQLGLPSIFSINDKTLVINEKFAIEINNIINNANYKKLVTLILTRSDVHNGTVFNGTFNLDKLSNLNTSLFATLPYNPKVAIFGYMVEQAINYAIAEVATKDNDQSDADAFELADIPKEIVDYFGGKENVISMFNTRIRGLHLANNNDIALIAAVPLLKENTVDYTIGTSPHTAEVSIPTDTYNTSGLSDIELQNIANSILFFYKKAMVKSKALLENIFDTTAISENSASARRKVKMELGKILKYYQSQMALNVSNSYNELLSKYINKISTILNDLSFTNSEVWDRFMIYLHKELDIIENSDTSLDAIVDNAIEGRGVLFGKARIQAKQTISSNIKNLLWGNIIFKSASDISVADNIDLSSADLVTLLQTDAIEISPITGLPITATLAKTKDMLLRACSGAVNKSDFINRLEDLSFVNNTVYPIVAEVTKRGNEDLLRKLYTALKLQSPLYVVNTINELSKSGRDQYRQLSFDIQNLDIRPSLAMASDLNNNISYQIRYIRDDAAISELENTVSYLLNQLIKSKKKLDSGQNIHDAVTAISNTIKELNKNGYKFAIYKAISKAMVLTDNALLDGMIELVNSYKQSISIERAAIKQAVANKQEYEPKQFKEYFKAIEVFKVFDRVPYYFTLDSFYTTVDLTTAHSYQLPNYLSEMIDKFNNADTLLELGKEWYLDPSVKYSRLFNSLFTYENDEVKIKHPELVGTYDYAILGGSVNNLSNNRVEYNNTLKESWIAAQMMNYLSDYMQMNGVSDGSRLYGIKIPNNKLKLDAKAISLINLLVTNSNVTDDIKAQVLKLPVFSQIRNIVYGEIEGMLAARNALYNIDPVTKELSERDGIDKIKLNSILFKDKNGEILSNGKATGNVFNFSSFIIKLSNGKAVTLYDHLKDNGINLNINGVPMFESEVIGSLSNSVSELSNNVVNAHTFAEIDNFVLNYMVYTINNRMKTINPIAEDLLEIKKAQLSEVNGYFIKDQDKLISPLSTNITPWAYSFILDELLSTFDWNMLFQGNTNEFSSAINQSKRLNQITRPGEAILSDEFLHTLTVDDHSTISNVINDIKKVLPDQVDYYTGKSSIKDEAATDGMTIMSRKGFEKFIEEQGLTDKYKDFLNAIDSKDYNSNSFKYAIQSLKPFYFDRSVKDYGNGLYKLTSEQIKHSIYVLDKSFAFSNDSIRLLEFMDKVGIDAIDFKSAEKIGFTSSYPISNLSTKELNDLSSITLKDIDSYIHRRPINKYRIQLQLPQHNADHQNKFATQIKRLFENLHMDENIYDIDGKKYTGKEIFSLYQELFSLNIRDSAIELYNEFGVSMIDEEPILNPVSGTYDINESAIYGYIVDFVRKYYNNPNLMKAMELNERGVSKLPLYFTTFAKKLEQRVISKIRNQVLHQRHVGAHAAIVANAFVGGSLTTIENVDKDKITFRSDYLEDVNTNRGGKMDLHIKKKNVTNPDGSKKEVLVAEAIISVPSSKFLDNGKVIDINELYELDPKMLSILSHRIPIEGEQSTMMIDVVGMINDKGSHIMLPDDIAVKSGADFDIDTSYLLSYNLEYHKGKLRTIPYYDELTDENKDYLFSKYVNKKLSFIVSNNIKQLKLDHQAKTEALINENTSILSSQLDDTLANLANFKTNDNSFSGFSNSIKLRFKLLERALVREGYTGFNKFNAYVNIMDYLVPVFGMYSQSKELVSAEVDKLDNRDYIRSFLKDIHSLISIQSRDVLLGNFYTLEQVISEYASATEYYTGITQNKELLLKSISDVKKGEWSKYKTNLSNAINDYINQLAIDNNLASMPIEQLNSVEARKNRMIDVLGSIISSLSHFEHVMKVNDFADSYSVATEINKLYGNDVFNLDYNNAVDRDKLKNLISSAKKLKGMSVAMDRTVAILKVVNVELANNSVEIAISKDELSEMKVTISTLKNKYGERNVIDEGNKVIIRSTTIGDNLLRDGRTIQGTNILNFVNQITAHILDSAQNPTSFNLNEYTLGVYKLLAISGITTIREGKESPFYYADAFINHPAVVDIANMYLNRKGVTAKLFESTDTNKIVSELYDMYIKRIYELKVKLDPNNKINIIEDFNKSTVPFSMSKLNNETKQAVLVALQQGLIDNENKNIPLVNSTPTLSEILSDIKLQVSINNLSTSNSIKDINNEIKLLAHKLSFLEHWVKIRNVSNDITELTTILKTDNIELNSSSVLQLDNKIGNSAFNYNELFNELSRALNSTGIRINVVSEINKFKLLSLPNQRAKLYGEYAKLGVNVNKVFKFKSDNVNLLESILPSAFGLNTKSSYSSLDSFYKHGVTFSKSIATVMFAHNFPIGKIIINSILKGVVSNNNNIETVITWFTNWLGSSSPLFNITEKEKHRIFDNKRIYYPSAKLIYDESNKEFKIKALVNKKNAVEELITTNEDLNKMSLLDKLIFLQGSSVVTNNYPFVSQLIATRNKKYHNSNIIKLIFPNNVTEEEAQLELELMYNDKRSPLFKSFIEDLFRYAAFEDGMMYGNKLSKFLPLSLLTEDGFLNDIMPFGTRLHTEASKLYNTSELHSIGLGNIRRLFYQSHWNNYSFVPTISINSKRKDKLPFKQLDLKGQVPHYIANTIIVSPKTVIDNSMLADKDYLYSNDTKMLYERIDPQMSTFLLQSELYYYRAINRKSEFEYTDTVINEYSVNTSYLTSLEIENNIDEFVSLIANNSLVVPNFNGIESAIKVNTNYIHSNKFTRVDYTTFNTLPTGLNIDRVAVNEFYNLYSTNSKLNKLALENIVASNSQFAIVLDDDTNNRETDVLFNRINIANKGNAVRLNNLTKSSLQNDLIELIKNKAIDNDKLAISIHAPSRLNTVDEFGVITALPLNNIINALLLLPVSSINQKEITILMADNANISGPIATTINKKQIEDGLTSSNEKVVNVEILFANNFLSYTDKSLAEINNVDSYIDMDSVTESMDLTNVQTNEVIDKLDQYLSAKEILYGSEYAFKLERENADRLGLNVDGASSIVDELYGKYEGLEDNRNEIGTIIGKGLQDIAIAATSNNFNPNDTGALNTLISNKYNEISKHKNISSSFQYDSFANAAIYVLETVNKNRNKTKGNVHKLYAELPVASMNPDAKRLVIGKIDLFDMSNDGGTIYDIKLSTNTTEGSDYYFSYNNITIPISRKHATQLMLYQRAMEKPAYLTAKNGTPLLMPRISANKAIIVPIRMILEVNEIGDDVKLLDLVVEKEINVTNSTEYSEAREVVISSNILPLNETEKTLYRERIAFMKARTAIETESKGREIVKNLGAALISLQKKYGGSDNKELVDSLNKLIPEIKGKIDDYSLDSTISYVSAFMQEFATFAETNLATLLVKANYYNSPQLLMQKVVDDSSRAYKFVKDMNVINHITSIIDAIDGLSLYSLEGIDDPITLSIVKEYNSVVSSLVTVKESSNKLKNLYFGLIKEYMAEMIAKYSRNPNAQDYIVRVDGKLDLDLAFKLFEYEDISQINLWLDSRFDHGIPFDDAVGIKDRIIDLKIQNSKRRELIKFHRLIGEAYKDNNKWRYKDTIRHNKEISDWFNKTFIAKDSKGNDTFYLVTAHNEHVFYNEFLELQKIAKYKQIAAMKENEKLFKNNEITIDEKRRRNQADTKAAYSELQQFLINKTDYKNRYTVIIGTGKNKVSIGVNDFIKSRTKGFTPTQVRIFLNQHNIVKFNNTYIVVRPAALTPNSDDNKGTVDQFNAIMENPKLKALYDYLYLLSNRMLDVNQSIIIDPKRIPFLMGKRRSNIESIKRVIGYTDVRNEASYPLQDVSGNITYAIKIPMLGILHSDAQIVIREKRADEPMEEYKQSVLEEVNKDREIKFENYDEIIAYIRNESIQRRKETVEQMEKNPIKIYNKFIESTFEYRKKLLIDEEYQLYISFLEKIAKVLTFNNRKPISDTTYQEATGEKAYQKKSGSKSQSNLYKRINAYQLYRIYQSDEFKESPTFEKISKSLRQYTSLRVMALNLKSGIKNVTKGTIDMLSEGKAGQFTDSHSLRKGFALYSTAIIDILSNIYTEDSNTLAGAFIKDYNTLIEKQNEKGQEITKDIHNIADSLLISLDVAYLFNNAGEHYMQYGMYLSMLNSHRIIDGKILNFSDYVGNYAQDLITKYLPKETVDDFISFKKKQMESTFRPFEYKDYFSQWLIRSTILSKNSEQLKLIKQIYKNNYKQSLKELRTKFETYSTVYDSHENIDNQLQLKKGVTYNKDEFNKFKIRVRVVNHSMHGVYNKIDANMMQYYSIGEAAMQFRKWMKPNWNRFYGKRFNRTIWNESSGTWQKGSAISMWELFVKPIIEYNSLDSEGKASTNLFKSILRYYSNIGLMYRSSSQIDKINIRRFSYNLSAFMGVIAMTMFLGGAGDDWKNESEANKLLYGLLMYELSSLTLELYEFAPLIGWKSIIDRFVDSPAPIIKTITDVGKLVSFASGELLSLVGVPTNTRFERGTKKGFNKLFYQTMSMAPGVKEVFSMQRLLDIVDYYKMNDPLKVMSMYNILTKSRKEGGITR